LQADSLSTELLGKPLELPYEPPILLLYIYQKKEGKKKKKTNSKIYMHHMLMAALFIIANIWKQPICPWMTMDKKCVIHTHNGILLSHKKRMTSCHL